MVMGASAIPLLQRHRPCFCPKLGGNTDFCLPQALLRKWRFVIILVVFSRSKSVAATAGHTGVYGSVV